MLAWSTTVDAQAVCPKPVARPAGLDQLIVTISADGTADPVDKQSSVLAGRRTLRAGENTLERTPEIAGWRVTAVGADGSSCSELFVFAELLRSNSSTQISATKVDGKLRITGKALQESAGTLATSEVMLAPDRGDCPEGEWTTLDGGDKTFSATGTNLKLWTKQQSQCVPVRTVRVVEPSKMVVKINGRERPALMPDPSLESKKATSLISVFASPGQTVDECQFRVGKETSWHACREAVELDGWKYSPEVKVYTASVRGSLQQCDADANARAQTVAGEALQLCFYELAGESRRHVRSSPFSDVAGLCKKGTENCAASTSISFDKPGTYVVNVVATVDAARADLVVLDSQPVETEVSVWSVPETPEKHTLVWPAAALDRYDRLFCYAAPKARDGETLPGKPPAAFGYVEIDNDGHRYRPTKWNDRGDVYCSDIEPSATAIVRQKLADGFKVDIAIGHDFQPISHKSFWPSPQLSRLRVVNKYDEDTATDVVLYEMRRPLFASPEKGSLALCLQPNDTLAQNELYLDPRSLEIKSADKRTIGGFFAGEANLAKFTQTGSSNEFCAAISRSFGSDETLRFMDDVTFTPGDRVTIRQTKSAGQPATASTELKPQKHSVKLWDEAMAHGSVTFGGWVGFTNNKATQYRIAGLVPLIEAAYVVPRVVELVAIGGWAFPFTLPGSESNREDKAGVSMPSKANAANAQFGFGTGPYAAVCGRIQAPAVPQLCLAAAAEAGVERVDKGNGQQEASFYANAAYFLSVGVGFAGGRSETK